MELFRHQAAHLHLSSILIRSYYTFLSLFEICGLPRWIYYSCWIGGGAHARSRYTCWNPSHVVVVQLCTDLITALKKQLSHLWVQRLSLAGDEFSWDPERLHCSFCPFHAAGVHRKSLGGVLCIETSTVKRWGQTRLISWLQSAVIYVCF